MDSVETEPESVVEFKSWLVQNGAHVHPDVLFASVPFGFSLIARRDIPADAIIVSCPFSLAITPELSKRSLKTVLYPNGFPDILDGWSERQLICSYICMHWVLGQSSCAPALAHWPYLNILPSPSKLLTPLHFTPTELETFKGTNLYGATLDRQRAWQVEWRQFRAVVAAANPSWGSECTWERYLTASTYLSSRAFPSTLLSADPSLVSTPSSYPILLPGIDALNHARAQPISWVVSGASSIDKKESAAISLVLHTPSPHGSELFNNYGPKPNAELILGYGFSLPRNPDDTIVLKIGHSASTQMPNQLLTQMKWEVGRHARGAEHVWAAVLTAVCEGEDADDVSIEDELFAAETLEGMATDLLGRLPPLPSPEEGIEDVRKEVALMLDHYLEGQLDILQSLVEFAQEKKHLALETAREQGVDLVEEGDEEDEE